ncbi:delta-60 repeat domain-containing protein/Por secretion system C-terminal sorting domain-containing protein [Hymenobacter daecheongensis DSM 21074]|uniref:Delta-60 repeat domain-containing protein/Por secretion system C-terminal sorting domain-containing protein n=1 Tax=Hymenobacter daecheongensis DSM 21074 TaxID=1121955 RepID=A0A1M6FXQ9_9BACT|nr:T9SS type A sorting domain-containing protein [Hymenobacter daecheongensis]SHJ02485.1 delta-60 repeat domain-containing protein/Por secretion system C-terminal sorting domain-containing protein [Hymenobacter daecheongensis DSM 21074]
MHRFYAWLTCILFGCITFTSPVLGQTPDPNFAPTVLKNAAANNFLVRALESQPDGKILVGGDFDFVDGMLCRKLMRLNADGTRDAAFSSANGTGPDGIITAIAVQPDSKIIVGGENTLYSFNGTYINTLTRLNAGGGLDPTFQTPPLAILARIRALALQPDGKILVGGEFHDQSGFTRSSIVRLNPNGGYDPSFAGNIYANSTSTGAGIVETICLQADGKIVVGGTFGFSNGAPASNLIRLNADGSTDATFAIGTGANNTVRTIVQQPDGRLLVGGYFTQLNGQTANRLVRLQPSGTLDNTFQPGSGANEAVMRIRLRPDGSLLVMGAFTQYNGVARGRIAHVSATGSLNAGFGTGAGADNIVYNLVDLPNGQLLAGGLFKSFVTTPRTGLARLSSAGVLDPAFAPKLEFQGILENVTALTSGNFLVQGSFTEFNGQAVPTSAGVHRLHADGNYDTRIATARTGTYHPQPDGSIYVLWHPSGTATNVFSRLLPTGADDSSFTPVTLGYSTEYIATSSMYLNEFLPVGSGRFVLGGYFISINGVAQTANHLNLVRLLPTGGVDPTFSVASTVVPNDNSLDGCLAQPNGKLVVQHHYTYSTSPTLIQTYLVRLNTDGSVDGSFSIGSGPSPQDLYTVFMQSNGQLIIQGSFISFNGHSANGIVRLNPNGSVDTGFALTNPNVHMVQTDGRFIIGESGSRPFFYNMGRLNADGSPDPSFVIRDISVAHQFISSEPWPRLSQLPNSGNLLLWGKFVYINGQPRMSMVRFTNTLLATGLPHAVSELAVFPNPAHQQITLRLPATAAQPLARPVELLDLQGRIVRRWTLPARQVEATFPTDAVTAGIYVLRTTTTQGPVQQRVVIAP